MTTIGKRSRGFMSTICAKEDTPTFEDVPFKTIDRLEHSVTRTVRAFVGQHHDRVVTLRTPSVTPDLFQPEAFFWYSPEQRGYYRIDQGRYRDITDDLPPHVRYEWELHVDRFDLKTGLLPFTYHVVEWTSTPSR